MDKGDLNCSANFWRDLSWDYDPEETNSDLQGETSFETSPFRGFEKEPKVLLEKFNIEPFLKNIGSKSNSVIKKNDIRSILPQLVSNSIVKLAREDLKQLRKEVLENSRRNKINSNGILNMPILRCKICEKAFKSEKRMQNHQKNKHILVCKNRFSSKSQKRVSFSDHVIVHELKEYHRCRKCTRIFDEYQSLKTHIKQVHSKRKCYICYYCSKNFEDRILFKVHIKLHCDVCGLLFPNKRKYILHRQDSCRIKKKYPCKTCQNKFFSYMGLKDHNYDHLEDLFICDICKGQHSSKCGVAHHISFMHSKKPKELYTVKHFGKENIYVCNFCDASSLDREVILKHVSVLPELNNKKRINYEGYFCDQCLGKFETEADMLQHKWSHFLNGPEITRIYLNTSEIRLDKSNKDSRTIFKLDKKLPNLMQPRIVLQRIDEIKNKNETRFYNNDVNLELDGAENNKGKNESTTDHATKDSFDNGKVGSMSLEKDNLINNGMVNPTPQIEVNPIDNGVKVLTREEFQVVLKKAIVDPKSKKTLLSRFQCKKCHKYYSNNFCLNRHMLSIHRSYSNYRCNYCEEVFAWPSLLKSHNCVRMSVTEHFDGTPGLHYHDLGQTGFNGLMENSLNFDIPAPNVELTEYENLVINTADNRQNSNYSIPVRNSYKIIMQEVPIEF